MNKKTTIVTQIKHGVYIVAGLMGLALSFGVGMLSENGYVKFLCILLLILSIATLENMSSIQPKKDNEK